MPTGSDRNLGEGGGMSYIDMIVRFGSPFMLSQRWEKLLFIAVPGVLAGLGALVCQGSYLRIVGAALGGCFRDLCLVFLVSKGLLEPTNPYYNLDCAIVLAFFGFSAAALLSCLSPYEGPVLWVMSTLGGLGGQFLFPPFMGAEPQADEVWFKRFVSPYLEAMKQSWGNKLDRL